jgi:hypothetical protein
VDERVEDPPDRAGVGLVRLSGHGRGPAGRAPPHPTRMRAP